MDFIQTEEGEGVLVELKYCERCGGLFVRTRGSQRAHCGGCRAQLEKECSPTTRRSKPRLPRGQDLNGQSQVPNQIGPLLGVAEMEVRL